MPNKKHSDIEQRSGCVCSTDPLVGFLYLLMRDFVPPGNIEAIMKQCTNPGGKIERTKYCNGWLADYAKDVANRLSPVVPK